MHFAIRVGEDDYYDPIVAQVCAHGENVEDVYFGDDLKAPGSSAYIEDPDGYRVQSRNPIALRARPGLACWR